MPAEFHFLRPGWLLALPLALALVWWALNRRLEAGSWRSVIDERLLAHMLDDRAGARLSRWPLVIAASAALLACLALAGPAWERQKQQLYRGGDSLVIALDLSRSMDAADVPPSRLERAKLKLMDLLERRREGQTALVVYSSHAFTVTPLTDDAETIRALIGSLATEIMPSRGSIPAAALMKAKDLLEQAGATRGHVLLIADGIEGDAVGAAAELRRAGYRTSVIGVGTSEGGPVPQSGGGFITDAEGRMVLPGLEEGLLQEVAAAGGGTYRRLGIGDADIGAVLSGMGRGVREPGAGGGEDFFTDLWHDQGPWLVLALLPLAALAFRRGWLLVLLIVILPLPEPAAAAGWRDLWSTPDQQASEAFRDGRHEEAAALFEDPAWRAAASYRAGDYAASAELLAGQDGVTAHYNRGNALARQGDYAAAIEAYEAALAADPAHEDARHNRDLLRQLQQQQQQQQGGGEGEPQQSPSSEEGEPQQGDGSGAEQQQAGEQSPGEQGEDAQESAADGQAQPAAADEEEMIERLREEMRREAEQQPGEGEQQAQRYAELSPEERSEQEQAQAMEQWLRRVPNDPGGLLRRKFLDQYRRQGRDQDGNRLWTDEEVEPW